MSLLDIVEFIVYNRHRGYAWTDYTAEQILCEVVDGTKRKGIGVSVNEQGKINGVATAEEQPNNILYVRNILTTHSSALKSLLRLCREHYPNHRIQGFRRKTGKHVEYRRL